MRRYVYRSAVTGRFVSKAEAEADPERHVRETVVTDPKPEATERKGDE